MYEKHSSWLELQWGLLRIVCFYILYFIYYNAITKFQILWIWFEVNYLIFSFFSFAAHLKIHLRGQKYQLHQMLYKTIAIESNHENVKSHNGNDDSASPIDLTRILNPWRKLIKTTWLHIDCRILHIVQNRYWPFSHCVVCTL